MPFSFARSAMALPMALAASTFAPFLPLPPSVFSVVDAAHSVRPASSSITCAYMCDWLRYTARRGRWGLPSTRLRMRSWMRARMSCFVLTLMFSLGGRCRSRNQAAASPRNLLRPGGPGLAGLLLQDLARVAHALLLVRIRLAQPADLGGHLSHLLAVDARHRDVGVLVHRDLDPLGNRVAHGVGVAQRHHQVLALDRRLEADADDVELLAEAGADALDGVVGQRPRQAVVGP